MLAKGSTAIDGFAAAVFAVALGAVEGTGAADSVDNIEARLSEALDQQRDERCRVPLPELIAHVQGDVGLQGQQFSKRFARCVTFPELSVHRRESRRGCRRSPAC